MECFKTISEKKSFFVAQSKFQSYFTFFFIIEVATNKLECFSLVSPYIQV